MADEKVLKYIKTSMSKGFSRKDVEAALLKAKYDPAVIKEAFNEVLPQAQPRKKWILPLAVILSVLLIVILFLALTQKPLGPAKTSEPFWVQENMPAFNDTLFINNNKTFANENLLSFDDMGLNPSDYLTRFVDNCKGTVNLLESSPPCDSVALFGLSVKFSGLDISLLNGSDKEKFAQLEPLLLSTKQSLLYSNFTSYSPVRRSIYALSHLGMLSEQEYVTLTEKYLAYINGKDFSSQRCQLLTNEVLYVQNNLGISSFEKLKEIYPQYASYFSSNCDMITKQPFADFCDDDYPVSAELCFYNFYYISKSFCGNQRNTYKEDANKVLETTIPKHETSGTDYSEFCHYMFKQRIYFS